MRSFSKLTAFCLVVPASWLITIAPSAAAPLDPAQVPADAKWVIHLDYEALDESDLMEAFRDKRPQMARRARRWLQERYGIDPREGLHGLTLFSDTYKPHSGAAILKANYDREQVEADILSKPQVKSTKWKNYTLYTWDADKRGKYRRHDDRQEGGRDNEKRRHENRSDPSVTAVLLDGETVVFAPSEERAKSLVEFLAGDKASLEGQDSRLVTGMPEESILYGAAIDLKEISQHERPFPILQQHDYAMWAFGERNAQAFEELTLEARSEDTARQMETLLEGFVALGKLWSADMKQLAKLYDDVHIRQEGNQVRVEWHGGTDETVAAVEEFLAQVKQWRRAKRERRQP